MNDRIPILKTYKLFIGGAFPRTESGRYFLLKNDSDKSLANVCLASRKDFRNAVVAARKAQSAWAAKSAYNRSQILYRIGEMLEGRKDQFISELLQCGMKKNHAQKEVEASVDRFIYYAGWADKYQQVFGTINPVASPHFNFSLQEPTGIVTAVAPDASPLLSIATIISSIIAGGNAVILLASEEAPLSAITLAEVIQTSDVPAGVVNILTGRKEELVPHFSSHMDVNAIWYANEEPELRQIIQENASLNVKRVTFKGFDNWIIDEAEDPYLILEFQEIKTTWHPVGV